MTTRYDVADGPAFQMLGNNAQTSPPRQSYNSGGTEVTRALREFQLVLYGPVVIGAEDLMTVNIYAMSSHQVASSSPSCLRISKGELQESVQCP